MSADVVSAHAAIAQAHGEVGVRVVGHVLLHAQLGCTEHALLVLDALGVGAQGLLQALSHLLEVLAQAHAGILVEGLVVEVDALVAFHQHGLAPDVVREAAIVVAILVGDGGVEGRQVAHVGNVLLVVFQRNGQHLLVEALVPGLLGSVEKYWGFFLFHSILYLCIMNMLEQLAHLVLPKEILDNFDIVKIETDESDIDSMSLTIHLDERMNAYLQKSEDYESKGFMDAVRITDFPIRDHKVILVLRRRRWKNKETGETFVDRISVTESGTRYSKEFAAFLKETYGHIPDDLPYA